MANQSVDLDMTRRVTANLWFWQGLRWAPTGILFAATAPLAWLTSDSEAWLYWVGLAGAAGLSWWLYRLADGYYTRRYGVVRHRRGQHARRNRLKWWVVYPAMLASLVVDILVHPPVFLTGIVWAAAILLYRRSTGGGRRHYFGVAALLAALAPLPALGLVAAGDPITVLWFGVMAVLYPIAGVLDHFELERRFPPVAEPPWPEPPAGDREPIGAPR